VKESKLAVEPITAKLTRAPGNGGPICGLIADGSRPVPLGPDNIYKIYAANFRD